ncbi:hypothetical protein PQ462_20575 [Flavobacterium sp. KACC 22758]|jgi:hypothetical protein|uniref:hypothetical protein n=1 Tax=Flavobacterium sp. KACC 22758 TaxID=3025667 RepID=UPI0023658E42|nr:hypothetical protein [Flavobacterium sp. KACC 22758]WDF59098.1 hypothetical protein PQ462_20575 [Flavobacterium sp. KACC 22758]
MEVFVPHLKDRNIYLDEIIYFSNCNFIFGDFNEYKNHYEIVNIQFPEAIFNWIAPTNKQLIDLERKIILWKKKSKVVFTLNDIKSHYDKENVFNDLFELIQKHVDAVIHLGNYSLKQYRHLFSENCEHTVIYHPLYESLISDFESADFNDKVQLSLKNKYLVSVIGNIRSVEEAKLVFKIFNKIPQKNKFLIVPNMFPFMELPSYLPYRFRKIYRKIAEIVFRFPLRKSQYFFGFKFIDYNRMVDLVQNSSLLIIPRIRNLNSGLLYLGLTFDKPMIIPKVGNMTEVADFFRFPTLDLEKSNFDEVVKRQSDSKIHLYFQTNEYAEKKRLFKPSVIAKEYETFFINLLKIKIEK